MDFRRGVGYSNTVVASSMEREGWPMWTTDKGKLARHTPLVTHEQRWLLALVAMALVTATALLFIRNQ
jgi:hypothetical protein